MEDALNPGISLVEKRKLTHTLGIKVPPVLAK
jgi:hypothetical protein